MKKIIILLLLCGCSRSQLNTEKLERKFDSLCKVVAGIKNTNAVSRIRRPKFLAAYVNGEWKRCDSVFEPGISFNGNSYGIYSGYAIKGDSGRLINNSGARFLVYPSNPRYYFGHERGYSKPKLKTM